MDVTDLVSVFGKSFAQVGPVGMFALAALFLFFRYGRNGTANGNGNGKAVKSVVVEAEAKPDITTVLAEWQARSEVIRQTYEAVGRVESAQSKAIDALRDMQGTQERIVTLLDRMERRAETADAATIRRDRRRR